jgi:protein-disulfide isomerase
LVLDIAVTVAVLIAAGVYVWSRFRGPQPPTSTIELPDSPVSIAGVALHGSGNARVILLEFSDYQCPFCGRFTRDTLPAIEEAYVKTGKALIGFRHLPLEQLHAYAGAAAGAAICAGRQGRFWEMTDLLFADQKRLDEAALRARAEQLDLDVPAFETCLVDPAVARQIQGDKELAASMKITGTPALLIGNVQADGRVKFVSALLGAVPLAEVQKALDTALSRSRMSALYLASGVALALLAAGGLAVRHRLGRKSRHLGDG